jgi:hypothetical protein
MVRMDNILFSGLHFTLTPSLHKYAIVKKFINLTFHGYKVLL